MGNGGKRCFSALKKSLMHQSAFLTRHFPRLAVNGKKRLQRDLILNNRDKVTAPTAVIHPEATVSLCLDSHTAAGGLRTIKKSDPYGAGPIY